MLKIIGIKAITSASKKLDRGGRLQVTRSNDYKKLYYYRCQLNSWYSDDKSEKTIFFIKEYTSMKDVKQKVIDGINHIENIKTLDNLK